MEKYPRRRLMHRPGMQKIFEFEKLADYERACLDGWSYNPADIGKVEKIKKEEKPDEILEDIPEPIVYRPEIPGQINLEPVNPLKCKLCDFVGKNMQSLRMHKTVKHKD